MDDSSILNHRLMETPVNQASPTLLQDALEDLVENFGEFSISSSIQTRKQLKSLESNSGTTNFFKSGSRPSDNYGPSLV